jgi:hypothetical protein
MTAQRKKKDRKTQRAAEKRAAGATRPPPGRAAAWWLRPRGAATIVFVVSVALYANTLGHGFVWDDRSLVVENHAVQTLNMATLQEIFTQDFWRVTGRGKLYYRPLTTLSYHVDYAVFNGSPTGFHWTNVFSNAITCVLVFAFVYVLFGRVALGLVTALLYAAHPIHTEAVAWVSGRTDVLASLWSLVSLICYVLARRRANHLLLASSAVAFVLAVFAKESAACVPFLILILEVGPFETLLAPKGARDRPRTRRSIIGPLIFLGLLVAYLLLRHEVIGTPTSMYPAFAPGRLGYVALPFSILAGYAFKTLLPIELSAEYDAPIPTSFADAQVIAGVVVASLILWGVWRFRRRADVILGLGIFVFGLAPVMNVVPIGEVSAERFLYFPSLGAALILAAIFVPAAAAAHPMVRRAGSKAHGTEQPIAGSIGVVLAIILIAFAARTIMRNPDWRNEEILFAKTAKQLPDNARVHANIAELPAGASRSTASLRSMPGRGGSTMRYA